MATRTYQIVSLEGVSSRDVPTLLRLLGLINRAGPHVYLLPRDAGPERHWVEWSTRYGLTSKATTVDDLIASPARQASGTIVYDPDLPDTINVAICLAGARDAVVCPPAANRVAPEGWASRRAPPRGRPRVAGRFPASSGAAVATDAGFVLAAPPRVK